MTRPDHEIDAYLEGQLTDEQARAIDAWIAADPANAAAFLHLIRTHQTLGIIGKEQTLSRQAAAVQPDQLDPITLASLAEMEAAAEPVPYQAIDQPFSFEATQKRQERSDASLIQALDDLRWASGKFASRLIRSPYGITGGIAAILILGLYLFVPFGSSDPTPPQDIADNTPTEPNEPGRVGPDTTNPIATLTATHNATWAEGASAPGSLTPGSKLHPNTRLTLTAGFAEITTDEGAVVILEAPATIELLNDDNALRLHAGKLVGICETESSKGFLVRTPHLDITDLGTQFGVDASTPGITEVHVINGEVEVTMTAHTGSGQVITQRLTQNQAVRSNHIDKTLVKIEPTLETFNAVLGVHLLRGTGIGMEENQADPAWRIVAVDGNPLTEAISLRVSDNPHSTDFSGSDRLGRWVYHRNNQHVALGGDHVIYTVQTEIVVPESVDLDQYTLNGIGYMDEVLVALRFNDRAVEILNAPSSHGEPWHFSTPASELGLRHGSNTVQFDIGNTPKTYTGLAIQWQLIGMSQKEERTND